MNARFASRTRASSREIAPLAFELFSRNLPARVVLAQDIQRRRASASVAALASHQTPAISAPMTTSELKVVDTIIPPMQQPVIIE